MHGGIAVADRDASPSAAVAVRAAAVASHVSWNAARVAAAGGEARRRAGGLIAYEPDADRGDRINVLFVERSDQRPAEVADEVLRWIAALPPLRTVGWWTTSTARNGSLAPVLLARGFQWGWRPHWMWLDPADPRPPFPLPSGIGMARLPDDDASLPPHVRDFGARHRALTHLDPPSTTVFAAFDGEGVIGSVTLHVSRVVAATPRGTAVRVGGLYDCWVVPWARRRGIGSALTAAAVARAEESGCRVVVLNATDMGEPMYRRVGFRSGGWGQTWWLVERQLRAPQPDAVMIRFVEAIGRGDVDALDETVATLRARPGGLDLDAQLPCGLTPLEVAAGLQQPRTARRLLDHGARLDVASAWDLGWRDIAADLLRERPGLANHRSGQHGATPLHIAVERGDEALARLVLTARPDLGVKDLTWQSDALGWAEHLGRADLAALIRAAAAGAEAPPGPR